MTNVAQRLGKLVVKPTSMPTMVLVTGGDMGLPTSDALSFSLQFNKEVGERLVAAWNATLNLSDEELLLLTATFAARGED